MDDPRLAPLKYFCERRVTLEVVAWQMPALGLASQTFLFIAVGVHLSDKGSAAAALVALVTSLATFVLMVKNQWAADLFEAIIQTEREELQLPPVHILEYAERLKDHPHRRRWQKKTWRRWIANRSAMNAWNLALAVFVGVDLAAFGLFTFRWIF
jgi:hypothetical protein